WKGGSSLTDALVASGTSLPQIRQVVAWIIVFDIAALMGRVEACTGADGMAQHSYLARECTSYKENLERHFVSPVYMYVMIGEESSSSERCSILTGDLAKKLRKGIYCRLT